MKEKQLTATVAAIINHYSQFVQEQTGKPKEQTAIEIKDIAKKILNET